MTVGEDRQDVSGHPPGTRVSVQEAAEQLDTTADAIRKRVQRGTVGHEKGQRQSREPDALISEMRGRIVDLREQPQPERQAHAEARRIIAGLVERMPGPRAVPRAARSGWEPRSYRTPPDAGEGPQEASGRPWWCRMFGG